MPVWPAGRKQTGRFTIMSADTPDGARHFLDAFSDPEAVARYADGPRRFVPGFDALHRMTGILLAERVPGDATVLVGRPPQRHRSAFCAR